MNLPEDYKQYMTEQLRRLLVTRPNQIVGVGISLCYVPDKGVATLEYNASTESGLCERSSSLDSAVDRLLRVGTFETVKL